MSLRNVGSGLVSALAEYPHNQDVRQKANSGETPEETLARLRAGSKSSTAGVASTTGPRYSPPLTTVRYKEGYRIDDVDDFLDRVHDLSPEQVRAVRFHVVRLTRGYCEEVVDALLDDIAGWLGSGVGVRQAIGKWSPP